ncbi:fructose-bisphosphatase class II, partial [Candidatus Daviesbacteria bacterium]|nr:fructose-bisphosphatase class II [Candidatus Daviesbacteria bacterium]
MTDLIFNRFQETFNKTTQNAALAAYKEIQKLHKEILNPETTDFKALGRLIDKAAVFAMQEVFETQSHFSIEIKGSEGRKDTRRDGIASPDLYGSYGPAKGIRVEIVNDAVEGTSSASRNLPGSTSVLAAVLNQKNGLVPTGNFDYMSKLVGPPQVAGKISLEFSPTENFKIALKELKIKNPSDLAVVILDRPRNQFEIESAQKLGITTILIQAGDLMPSLLAVQDPKIFASIKDSKVPKNIKGLLIMGSGGWEEGIIAAAAAKALGGHAEGRIYSEEGQVMEQAKIMGTSELVPADKSSILVSTTPITQDPWFSIAGITNDLKSATISITHQGMENK